MGKISKRGIIFRKDSQSVSFLTAAVKKAQARAFPARRQPNPVSPLVIT